MCGICGVVNFDRQAPIDQALLGRMIELIHHRGPDESGVFVSQAVGLGHRRLSIIDLASGQQPMCNEDGTIRVVYNGEIYNFAALRAELKAHGHIFKSGADTEVLVHAYEQWGEASVNRLRGMFAYAIWDTRKELLMLARDRVGIKPLYYANTGDAVVFASELKSVLAHPGVSRQVNRRAIDASLKYGYLPGTDTLLEAVHKLPAGHVMTVCDGKVQMRSYWQLVFEPKDWKYDDAVSALQGLLSETVKDHLISDVPVGVLLSGGVDSTAMLSYAVEHSSRNVNTFTIGFAGGEVTDERPQARRSATAHGCDHHERTVTAKEFGEFLPKYTWHMEEPICEPPATALYFISKMARDAGVKVLLSGEGGDEAFAGYRTYRNILLLERLKSFLGPARGVIGAGLTTAALAGRKSASDYVGLVSKRLSDYYGGRTVTPLNTFAASRGELYKREFLRDAVKVNGGIPSRTPSAAGELSALNLMLSVDSNSWLPDDLLVKADKMTMASSVELRVPLLDHRVLEFAASLPETFKFRNGVGKRVLREALRGRVPQQVLSGRKAGFPVPYAGWLAKDLKEMVRDTLLNRSAAIHEYFEPIALERLLAAQSTSGNSKGVFSLLVLESFHQQFVLPNPEILPSTLVGSQAVQ